MMVTRRAHLGGTGGFSLLEAVVVLGLLALSLSLSYPAFQSLFHSRSAEAAAREMLLCMRMARWKSLVTGCRTRLVISSPAEGTPARYVIEREEKEGWVREGDDHRLHESLRLSTTGPEVKIFTPNGTSSMGSVLIESAGGKSYRLGLNPATGRVRLYRGKKEVVHEG